MIYLLFALIFFSDSTDVAEQTEIQVLHFTEQLQDNNDKKYILWALNEIASSSCEGLEQVKLYLSAYSEYSIIYQGYSCSNISEIEAFDFKSSWSKTKRSLFESIMQGEKSVELGDIGTNSHLLFHYQLLMSAGVRDYYSTEYLEQALSGWIDLKSGYRNSERESVSYALLLSNIIRSAYALDRFDIVIQNYDEFTEHKYIPNSVTKQRLLGAIDYTLYATGNYDKSLEVSRKYLEPLSVFLGNESSLYSIKLRQGASLFSLGKYQESKKMYEDLYNQSVSFEKQYYLFTNLGINYLKLGQSRKYLSFQLRALDQGVNNYKSLLNIYRNLFIYYTSIKDVNSATQYIEKAKDIANNNQDTTELALIDLYLGSFYWTNFRDSKKALSNFKNAAKILSPTKDYDIYTDLLLEKGNILIKIDSLLEAQKTFQEVKKLTLSRSDTPDYVASLINLTAIDLKQNKLSEAARNLEEIKLYPLDDIDFQLTTKYHTIKNKYLSLTGNDRAAIDNLLPVIDQVIERAKNNTDSQEGYWSVEDEYLDAFEFIVELLIHNNRSPEALTILDRLKTINDATLYNNPLVKAAKLTEEELAEEKKLAQRIQSLRKKYLNASEGERFQINMEIDRLSAAREQILAEVNLDKDHPLPPIWSIQRSLKKDELLLHFTEAGTKLYVSYLTSSQIRIKHYNFDKQRQALFTQIGDNLASGNTNLLELYRLYEILGLKDIPNQIKQISVIPDNYLYRIPLEVLPTEEPDSPISFGSARYLIEDYHLRYFTSLKEFGSNRRSFSTPTEYDFSGFAISNFQNFKGVNLPSLPYATVETNNITNVLSSFNNKKVFTNDAATKTVFKQKVATSRLVHVATHSEISEQDPLFSTIYLKNSSDSDTLQSDQALYAYELFDTPLNSEFIMLNSCSSGSGQYIQGSGIMGISRALRYAGAKSLALNLWSVNDKVASEFATDFYDLLNKGETKSEAIRQAKLNQLKRANANPHFWGAYMMIGNPSPVTAKSTNAGLMFSLLALTMLLTGFITYRRESA